MLAARLTALCNTAVLCALPRVQGPFHQLAALVRETLAGGGKILVAGNGGSASQAAHFAGELLGKYRSEGRFPLPCIDLSAHVGALTAISNDWDYAHIFRRQIVALARPGDLVLLLSTSGRSPNIVRAADTCSRLDGVRCAAITGTLPQKSGRPEGTKPETLADCKLDAHVEIPSTDTATIQELTLFLIHSLCEGLEDMTTAEARFR